MVERRMVEDGSMLAEGLNGGLAPESFGTGRVCIESSCQVLLSRYNSTDWCTLPQSPAATGRPFDTSVRPHGRRRNSRRRNQQKTAA